MITKAEIGGISPFFIVKDAPASFSFYRDQLGFEITFQGPGENPFFGIVDRGGAMIMLKDVGVDPLPNHKREPMARWDAYVYVPDPDDWPRSLPRAMLNFRNPSKTLTTGCAGLN